jgi:hypothetical protein
LGSLNKIPWHRPEADKSLAKKFRKSDRVHSLQQNFRTEARKSAVQ